MIAEESSFAVKIKTKSTLAWNWSSSGKVLNYSGIAASKVSGVLRNAGKLSSGRFWIIRHE